jgi:hypothetical protein
MGSGVWVKQQIVLQPGNAVSYRKGAAGMISMGMQERL